MPRTKQAEANALGRTFGAASLQTNWLTQTLEISSVAGGATYPVLYPSTSADGTYTFQIDAIMMGVGFSGCWHTAAAAEKACVAIAPKAPFLRITGSPLPFYQTMISCKVATAAGQIIQRNPGFMFPPPLVRYMQAGTTVQLFGSRQAAIEWDYLATIYYVTVSDYLKLMDASAI